MAAGQTYFAVATTKVNWMIKPRLSVPAFHYVHAFIQFLSQLIGLLAKSINHAWTDPLEGGA